MMGPAGGTLWPSVRAGAVYFALVFGAGFLLGTVRVFLLIPRIGVRAAELAEMPVMLLVIVLAARYVVRRFALPPAALPRLAAGCLALLMLVAAEMLLAMALAGISPRDYLASRDPVSGSVYFAMLGVFAVLPWLLARRRRPTR